MLIAYEVALEVIRSLRPVVEKMKTLNGDCAKQLQRAASNTVHNLGEGQRRRGGDKRHAYEIAHSEAREVLASLDLAEAWGWVLPDREVRQKLDRLLALCWGLTHGRARRGTS
jgi:four helix bundle protein